MEKKRVLPKIAPGTPKARPKPKPRAATTATIPKPQPPTPTASTPLPKPQPTKPTATAAPSPKPAPQQAAPQTPTDAQMTYTQLKELTHKERLTLSASLNKANAEVFTTLIKHSHLPKQYVLRLLEARARGILEGKAPKDSHVYYCPYCVDYMKFHLHSYSGYHRCIGCGISTRDYYVSADNNLFY